MEAAETQYPSGPAPVPKIVFARKSKASKVATITKVQARQKVTF